MSKYHIITKNHNYQTFLDEKQVESFEIDDIQLISKEYLPMIDERLCLKSKLIILYTSDCPEVTANEYIRNYTKLKEIYGDNALSELDFIIIQKFCP